MPVKFSFQKCTLTQRVCMKGSREFRAAACNKGESLGQIIFAHGRLEIGEPERTGVGLLLPPMRIKTDRQAAEHPQNPQTIGAAHAAAVVIERDIQALVGAILNAPALAVGLEPRLGWEFLWRKVGDETDRFVFAPHVLTGHQSGLGGEGKADILSGNGAAFQGAALAHPLIFLHGARPGGRRGQRGKNPPAVPELSFRCSGARWVGCF